MRKKMIAGNWKMNIANSKTAELIAKLNAGKRCDVLIAPPFTSLEVAKKAIGNRSLLLSAQNMHFQDSGAFTGEISPLMIKDIGCTHVLLGHSERRHIFNEDDKIINAKVKAAYLHGITAILCVGEKREERRSSKTEEVLSRQLKDGLAGIERIGNLIVAYEPVWAIGTGDVATVAQISDAHKFIRSVLKSIYSQKDSDGCLILYGGSVNDQNAKEILSIADVDGCLIGGASLKAESFNKIIDFADNI